ESALGAARWVADALQPLDSIDCCLAGLAGLSGAFAARSARLARMVGWAKRSALSALGLDSAAVGQDSAGYGLAGYSCRRLHGSVRGAGCDVWCGADRAIP